MPNIRQISPLAHSVIDTLLSKWRQPTTPSIRLAALNKIGQQDRLRKIATASQDEDVLLFAGLKLNDKKILERLSCSAKDEKIRLSAAIAIGDEKTLCQISIDCWDIEQGKTAIKHIKNKSILNQIVHKAVQDHIRLEAARRLGDLEAMRKIGCCSNDPELRLKVATELKDEMLLAELAYHRPANPKSRSLRQKAIRALMLELDELGKSSNVDELLNFIENVRYTSLKVEAFCKIPKPFLGQRVLLVMCRQNLQYVKDSLLGKMFAHISAAGWAIKDWTVNQTCRHCKGSGRSAMACQIPFHTKSNPNYYPCHDCYGNGVVEVRIAACKRNDRILVFKIPRVV